MKYLHYKLYDHPLETFAEQAVTTMSGAQGSRICQHPQTKVSTKMTLYDVCDLPKESRSDAPAKTNRNKFSLGNRHPSPYTTDILRIISTFFQ